MAGMENKLIGIGLYTPADASRLSGIPAAKLTRWLRGYTVKDREHPRLWTSQIDLGDDRTYLGFRDLMEARVANKFIELGISPQRIRKAIALAQEMIGEQRPLSTNKFRTDGRTIFLRTTDNNDDGEERAQLLDLFKSQYSLTSILDPLLKDVEMDDMGLPAQWWPRGRTKKILIDPQRAFGQPIDEESNVPTAILAEAAKYHGIDAAARDYEIPRSAIRRAVEFEGVELKTAA
jgi:uncharacterized protein (DUF433 family)